MRAGELLAKSQAMFTDKMLVAGRFQHDHLDRVSDEELMDKIAHSAAVLAEMGIVIPLLPESTEVDQKVPESEG
jgi:hypothetical protein